MKSNPFGKSTTSQLILLLAAAWCCALANAQVPHKLSYQGYLTNASGTPINVTTAMTFKLYVAPSGGAALYTEIQPSVSVAGGIFNAVIGAVTALNLPFDVPYYLGVSAGGDPEMTPRQLVTASPYALHSINADALATGGAAGQVLAGTGGAPTFTSSPTLNGNLTLANSTAVAGNILKGPTSFIHNFGTNNVFVGAGAGNFTMTGTDNAVSGYQAFVGNTGGSGNVTSGSGALAGNTSGNFNTGLGYHALYANTTASVNTAVGSNALANNTVGTQNVAMGEGALYSNVNGNSNTAYGWNALVGGSANYNNTAIGVQALAANNIGAANLAIGYRAGINLSSGNYNIYIAHDGIATESNTMRIGDSGYQNKTFIAGIRGITTINANAIPVVIDFAGQLGTVSSSRRVKDDIADMDAASSELMKLRPVTFHYKSDHAPAGRTLQYGLVAEEVASIDPGLVALSADGQIETVMYQFLPPMLLNEYQKQQRTIEAQADHIAQLERDRQAQSARIDALESQALEMALLKRQLVQLVQLREPIARVVAHDARADAYDLAVGIASASR
jgi:Chaperone of endosialidase